MNIFMMLFMVINFFTYAAYSMEKDDLGDRKVNPIDAELLRRVVKEEIISGHLDIIQKIKDIINNQVKLMQSYIENLNNKDKLSDKVNFIAEYFDESYLDNEKFDPKFKSKLNRSLTEYSDALHAEITALHILHNSLSYDLSRQQLVLLLSEVLRLVTTNMVNYNKTKGDIWHDNANNAANMLALLLVIIETTDESTDKEMVLVFCHENMGKPNWFWKLFIDLMDIQDPESPLWLSKKDKAFFRYDEVKYIQVPVDLNLKETKLFMVLDINARLQLGTDGHLLLTKYSIFDGNILEYIKKEREYVLETLLAEDKTKGINKYQPQKTPKKYRYKKGYEKNKQKIPVKKNKIMITSHNTINPYNKAPATMDNKVVNEDNDFIAVKQPKILRTPNYDEKYPIIIKHRDNNKLRDKMSVHDYTNLVSLAKTRKLHQYEYDLYQDIFVTDKANEYLYNKRYYDIAEHFNILNKKIKKAALIKPKYNVDNLDKKLYLDERKITKQNLFTYFITFHLTSDNNEKFTETYYGDVYSSSKSKSDTWIMIQDILSEVEKKNYDQSSNVLKHLYSCDLIASHCKKAVDGYWLRNARHTEPIFVIDFSEAKLASFIKDIYTKHPNRITTIDAVVMGVVSEYDICGRCQSLLQGLQWNLSHILRSSLKQITRRDMTELIKINPELITMIIASTGKPIENTRILAKEPEKFNQEELILDDGENHRLFLSKNNL